MTIADLVPAPSADAPTSAADGQRTGAARHVSSGSAWRAEHAAQLEDAVRVADEWRASRPGLAPDPAALATVLYERWYAPAAVLPAPDPLLPPLAGALRQAHVGAESWLDATVLRTGPAGLLLVARPGEPPRAVVRGDHTHPPTSDRRGLPPVPGEAVRVRERRDAPPTEGWWRTWGPGWNLLTPPTGLTRLYLAPEPEHVAALVREVTTATRSLTVPWMLKVAEHRAALARPDAMVLYLAQDLATVLDALAARVVAATAGRLRAASPALTFALAPGLAAAEDPGDGRSFGEQCCALVADALVHDPAGDDPIARVAHTFAAAEIDPAQPYLRAARPQDRP
ncbi:T3SS effector HopA1 family protein [Cellulomonas sp.]|uniref:T3SS effector HopA1 family protein n=1 Tax=Cellulomonas sp. TaxID=40001 RepID=UPI001AFD67B4|nr:T3SS effector HopA1 family protein [Cellulomonas sp.]MBO9553913.1 hypothetical protein [Cellulomonas sp.]